MSGPVIRGADVWFRTVLDIFSDTLFYFSLDGINYYQLSRDCKICGGFWKGARIALFSYNTDSSGGRADFNGFTRE